MLPGRQKTVPDAIQYLISIGVPLPSSGYRGGVAVGDRIRNGHAIATSAATVLAGADGNAG
jgi:hypothetical protein